MAPHVTGQPPHRVPGWILKEATVGLEGSSQH